ncbi:hypothetical protein Tco_0882754 [Tanacetum coccineum]
MVWSGYAVLMSGKTDSIKLNNIPGCLPGSTFVYSEVFKLDFSSASHSVRHHLVHVHLPTLSSIIPKDFLIKRHSRVFDTTINSMSFFMSFHFIFPIHHNLGSKSHGSSIFPTIIADSSSLINASMIALFFKSFGLVSFRYLF